MSVATRLRNLVWGGEILDRVAGLEKQHSETSGRLNALAAEFASQSKQLKALESKAESQEKQIADLRNVVAQIRDEAKRGGPQAAGGMGRLRSFLADTEGVG